MRKGNSRCTCSHSSILIKVKSAALSDPDDDEVINLQLRNNVMLCAGDRKATISSDMDQ